MNKRFILGPVLAVALATGTVSSAVHVLGDDQAARQPASDRVRNVETFAVTDLGDDRRLVGFAEDVFVAKVLRERGRTATEPVPEVQYDVQVVRAVKGRLSGNVAVSQQGGVDESGTAFVVDGDRPLQVGRAYLFAARTNPLTGWHTIVPKYGDLPVAGPLAQAQLVQRFALANAAAIAFQP